MCYCWLVEDLIPLVRTCFFFSGFRNPWLMFIIIGAGNSSEILTWWSLDWLLHSHLTIFILFLGFQAWIHDYIKGVTSNKALQCWGLWKCSLTNTENYWLFYFVLYFFCPLSLLYESKKKCLTHKYERNHLVSSHLKRRHNYALSIHQSCRAA